MNRLYMFLIDLCIEDLMWSSGPLGQAVGDPTEYATMIHGFGRRNGVFGQTAFQDTYV